ncbi:hypothetical protein ACGFI3_42830 [Nonomuraea wenchangensis]|uniref:hypothetical protein n=1 Tax=Nonomuraea wenchangensis TaxID=568860 RepID=UPI0037246A73
MPSNPSGPVLPVIPGCTVRAENGVFKITHIRSGDTLTADTLERAEVCGMILRITATWNQPLVSNDDIRFTTGDMP